VTNFRFPDSDLDGMSDYWELAWNFDIDDSSDGQFDPDLDGVGNNQDLDDDDGLTDDEEADIGTNPLYADSEYDSLQDDEEIALGLDPLNPNDCPYELCPPSSSVIKMTPLLLDSRDKNETQ
jgi:hypothetical protein